ncbi:Transferase [Penicillium cataractarum]|uniref:Transferase n=1 Tax=Penicillium cataractarum TaxID=2100454 RepID=A0A9W9RAV0_9EURO|nr:Transferase [Penicillium cataractarum]KAJ5355414.1 Transferase [Penicillium cataractarum]
MAALPAFKPYVLTPLDHSIFPVYLYPSFAFHIESPGLAIPILELAVSRLVYLLPFLTGNITASTQLKGKENVLEVQPPTQRFLMDHPMLKIKHHRQCISPMTSGSNIKTDQLLNESLVPIPFEMAAEAISPIFRIQANIMSNGLILCLAFHHMAMDGVGLLNVATALATCCRDSRAEIETLPTDPQREEHSRQLILENGHVAKRTDKFEAEYGEYSWDLSSSPECDEPTSKIFKLDASKIERIKTECQLMVEKHPNMPNPQLTSNTVVTAILWLCWIRAKHHGLDSTETPNNAESSILTAADIRGKIEPCLPSSYLGNAIMTVETSARIQDLWSTKDVHRESYRSGHVDSLEIKHISRLAGSLQISAESIDSQYISNVISHIVSNDNWAATPRPAEFLVSSIRAFKLYDLDFGPTLGPLRDFGLDHNRIPGFCWIKPARYNTTLAPWELIIMLEPKFMRNLERDGLINWLILKDGPRL